MPETLPSIHLNTHILQSSRRQRGSNGTPKSETRDSAVFCESVMKVCNMQVNRLEEIFDGQSEDLVRSVHSSRVSTTEGFKSIWSPKKPEVPASSHPGVPGNKVNVYIVTWNMHGKAIPSLQELKKAKIVPKDKEFQHIYVFGSQECERSIGKSFLNRSKKNWETVLGQLLGPSYVMIASSTLVAIHQVVFVHKKIVKFIRNVWCDQVACGFLNQLGNKGCASVAFRLFDDEFIFMCCHFAAHQKNSDVRDANYHHILMNVDYQIKEKKGLFLDMDHIFLFGDLNYRIHKTREEVDQLLVEKDLQKLLVFDQMNMSKRKKSAFVEFKEYPISFLPTYKYDSDSQTFDSGPKQRIQGWTDRILWRGRKIKCIKYDSLQDVTFSDHRPVIGKYVCAVTPNDDETNVLYSQTGTAICSIS